MIIINGKKFLGSNVTIVDGKIMSNIEAVKIREFDEEKLVEFQDIERIVINSSIAGVYFSDSAVPSFDYPYISAHFYGEARVDGEIDFNFKIDGEELDIDVTFNGSCTYDNLKLDIELPPKVYKSIVVKCMSADVTLTDGITTESLSINTQSGDIESMASFKEGSIHTMSGDADVYIDAEQDTSLKISSMSGNVSLRLQNIEQLNLSTSTMSGEIKNSYKESKGYSANVDISTMSGDIKIV